MNFGMRLVALVRVRPTWSLVGAIVAGLLVAAVAVLVWVLVALISNSHNAAECRDAGGYWTKGPTGYECKAAGR